jgi:hypothetical protein
MRIARHLVLVLFVGMLAVMAFGCEGRATVPQNAHLEQEGTGSGLSYTAREPGNLFILDKTKDKKVFEGKVNTGDQVVVRPDRDQIVVAGNDAHHSETLHSDHHYQIYFDPNH